MAKMDIEQHVTNTIIAQIEAGTPPWRKPWTGGKGGAAFPMRHNGERYRGINILMLWAMADEKGYNSARWMTYKQAAELGGTVRKGEKATKSVFYGTYERETEGSDGEPVKRRSQFAKCNNVFNADQIEGLPEEYYIKPEAPRDLGTETDPELEAFFAATGVTIVITEDPRAYYNPANDHIHMPPIATFHDAARYFGVLSHECVHWTGATKRLDRLKKFADREAYAFEELVAEIGACILAAHIGVEPDFGQSASYVEGWLKALKDDKRMIFRAASEAQKAVDYILNAASFKQEAAA